MRESEVESYLIKGVTEVGGHTRKLNYIGRRDAPDRLVLFTGFACLVELKAPGEKPTMTQSNEHKRLRKAGLEVFVIDSFSGVDRLIERYRL